MQCSIYFVGKFENIIFSFQKHNWKNEMYASIILYNHTSFVHLIMSVLKTFHIK